MPKVKIKRIYDDVKDHSGTDGSYRVLVDRIWPRGISKDKAQLDDWFKDLAPSTELRKWFDHEEAKYPEFEAKYLRELDSKTKLLEDLLYKAKTKDILLLYGAKDEIHNQAVILKETLESML